MVRPQPGAQLQFLQSPADICIYGGAAGGGKSFALLIEGMRHYEKPGFGGVIFRRTSTQLEGAGSLWEKACELYPVGGGEMRQSPTMAARFPSGALVQFLHLQHAKNVHDHQGKEYAFIAFDELTHFTEQQFWYLVSRNRSTCGVRPYIRATTNPDPDSFVRKLIAWWIGDPKCEDCQGGTCRKVEHGTPNLARSGKVRWFTRIGGALLWASSRDACERLIRDHGLEPGKDAAVLSLSFIAASLDDNPALLRADPDYKAKLMALDEVERERLLGGNWNSRPASGKYLKESYFARRWSGSPDDLPPMHIYTASDYAVTERDDADWTEHGVFGIDASDDLYVLDWWSGQTTADVWIERLIDKWAQWEPMVAYGEGGVIRQTVEPFLQRRMLERRVYADVQWINAPRAEPSESKGGFSDPSKRAKARKGRAFQARAAMGKIIFPANAPWVDRVIGQCVAFPAGHDDAYDVLALMCMALDADGAPAERPTPTRRRRDVWSDRKSVRSWKMA